MAVDIGPKIGIDGEQEFRRQINEINQSLKTMASEQKAVASAFDEEADAEKRSAAQKEVINRQIEAQKKKLELLEKGLRDSTAMYGESDVRTKKWEQAVHDATTTLNGMEHELKDVDKGLDSTSESMQESEKAATGWADVMKGTLLSDAVKAGLQKMAELVKGASTALWDAAKAGAAYADDILTLASTTGLSTSRLQEYKYMADLVDVSLETITGSMTKMESKMATASDGTGEAAEAWKKLGVRVTNANGSLRTSEEVFNETLKALGKIENETERDTVAMTLFGKSAKELNPLIETGVDALNDLAKEAHDTGYVLSNDSLKAMGKAQDAMDRFGKKTEAVTNRIGAKLAPSLEKAYNTMGEALDNPRVKRGLDLLSEGFGSVISKASDLAAKILPDLFSVFNMGDVKLKTYTDAELALADSIDNAAEAYEQRNAAYKEGAGAVLDETERTKNLWKELQNLTTESGYVEEKDRTRANFLITELNEALGTEYSMQDGIIQQYRTMQTEIDKLIKKREAEALLGVASEKYAQDYAARVQALRDEADARIALENAQRDLATAIAERNAAEQAYYDAEEGSDEDELKAWNEKIAAVNDLTEKVASLESDYEKASKLADDLYRSVYQYEQAAAEIEAGNYENAIKLLGDEWGATLEYYKKKKQLSDTEKEELQNNLATMEGAVKEYRAKMEQGLEGYTEAGLDELKQYVFEAKSILNGIYVGQEWLAGLKKGLEDPTKQQELKEASVKVGNLIVNTTKKTMQIRSPSRIAEQIGVMWDKGLVKGMEEKEDEIELAAESLANTIQNASTPEMFGTGYNALTASGVGYGATSNAYTTNMGGITIRIDGAGAVDEDVLAQRVAVQLTHELQRAQRGGRR